MLGVKRLLAVPFGVVVLNIVVHKGGLVEALDRHGDLPQTVGDFSQWIVLQRPPGTDGEEGTPSFSGARQPLASYDIGMTVSGLTENIVQGVRSEPAFDFLSKRVQIEAARAVITREMDHVPNPIEVDRGVLAVVLKQGYRYTRNRGGFHIGECLLQNGEAAHSDDGVDLPGLDQRHHKRRALRNKHGIAETLGFRLKVLDGAQSALFAKQAEFIERRGAFVFHAQTFRKQQQTAIVRHGSELVAPHFVVEQHPSVIEILGIDTRGFHNSIGMAFQLIDEQRRRQFIPMSFDVRPDKSPEPLALRQGRGNGFLRLSPRLRWHGPGHDHEGRH